MGEGAFSDSECGPIAGSVDNLVNRSRSQLVNGGGTKSSQSAYGLSNATDFDKRKRRKHELLEEVT
jgi:hypothetical protein